MLISQAMMYLSRGLRVVVGCGWLSLGVRDINGIHHNYGQIPYIRQHVCCLLCNIAKS